MPSFRVFAAATALACAAFTLAVPQLISDGIMAVESSDSGFGGSDVTSVADIVNRAVQEVQPITCQLDYITSQNNTQSIVKPLLNDVQAVLSQATNDMKTLCDTTVNWSSSTACGTWSKADLCKLVGELLCLVLGALGNVLSTVSILEYNLIFPLLAQVGCDLGNLLSLIVKIIGPGQLVPSILPLIQDVLPTIGNLGIGLKAYACLGVF
ncbi:hypothetical protein K435DRAFT_889641 [Dendrothele bispora CBS 962.96]|uniref:Uncharacterized protein n=1 Tax=Dendrothele bispora (strain CBS 962.96) TaxID=1314807 RepID=A0A4S8KQV3_DENBC|nr:hypothetical protein K435DRAFT_889641 [Dendrothele bispora CBS 962.96]